MNELEKKAIKQALNLAESFDRYPTYKAIGEKMKELDIDGEKINDVCDVFDKTIWEEKDKVNEIIRWLKVVLNKDGE